MQSSHEQVVDPAGAAVAADQVKELLHEHVPLSLIMDLTAPDGPHSRDILDAEGGPEQAWWAQD